MKPITVSAPGKLMLFGEHAVLYGHSCIVTAVDQRICATVTLTDLPVMTLEAPDVSISGYTKPMNVLGSGQIPKGAMFVEAAVKNFALQFPFSGGVSITTASEFSPLFGFGSSAASTVCTVKALAEASGKRLSDKKIFEIAYKTILDIQKRGSGFDVAAAIYGKTLYYVAAGKTIQPIMATEMPLVIGYTGVKADTVTLMREVGEKMAAQPERVSRIYDAIAKLTEDARRKILEGDWERVGKFMDFNQEYLRDLGVSSGALEALISGAKNAGAWGAKLSGAGGGDCMVALVSKDRRTAVEEAISIAGGQVIHILPNASGVRTEL